MFRLCCAVLVALSLTACVSVQEKQSLIGHRMNLVTDYCAKKTPLERAEFVRRGKPIDPKMKKLFMEQSTKEQALFYDHFGEQIMQWDAPDKKDPSVGPRCSISMYRDDPVRYMGPWLMQQFPKDRYKIHYFSGEVPVSQSKKEKLQMVVIDSIPRGKTVIVYTVLPTKRGYAVRLEHGSPAILDKLIERSAKHKELAKAAAEVTQ